MATRFSLALLLLVNIVAVWLVISNGLNKEIGYSTRSFSANQAQISVSPVPPTATPVPPTATPVPPSPTPTPPAGDDNSPRTGSPIFLILVAVIFGGIALAAIFSTLRVGRRR